MTFREKLAQESPTLVNDEYIGGCSGCPWEYGYEPYTECPWLALSGQDVYTLCAQCWNREIPE